MNYPTTSQIKSAFLAITEAEAHLVAAKKGVLELHYASEEVDHSAFLLENLKGNTAPSDDAGEVLFLRHQTAQGALTASFRGEGCAGVEEGLKTACGLAGRAVRLLHGS